MCAIKVNNNEKWLNTNVSKGTENTSDTSKKDYGEAGNICNIILNFYKVW